MEEKGKEYKQEAQLASDEAKLERNTWFILINRPGVFGAVWQTPLSLIHWLINSFTLCENI